MLTAAVTARFRRDWARLSRDDRALFKRVVCEQFLPDLRSGRFRATLGMRRISGTREIWELTWAPHGRATWECRPEQVPGERHVVWRRVGTPDVVDGDAAAFGDRQASVPVAGGA